MKCADCKLFEAGICTLTNDPTDPDINIECDYFDRKDEDEEQYTERR